MRILMVASEAQPFAKTGGLADVLGALPRALARLGHEVDVVMPGYRGISSASTVGPVIVPIANQKTEIPVQSATDGSVRTFFVEHAPYFDRDYLYGAGGHDYPDNP